MCVLGMTMAKVRKPSKPYGVFDGKSVNFDVDKDWSKARVLIVQNKPIPKDLEIRLLKYKELTGGR